MERITAEEASRTFSELLDRVRREGASFEITEGEDVVARVEPPAGAGPGKVRTLAELVEHIKKGPRLDPEDSLAFEADLAAIRAEMKLPDIKWD